MAKRGRPSKKVLAKRKALKKKYIRTLIFLLIALAVILYIDYTVFKGLF